MADLDTYRRKRDFSRTPEPAGDSRRSGQRRGALQFVVQQHAARRLHYDLRLELDGVLLSWAVPKGPSLDPRDRRLAVRTEDHPLEYAAFEGVIPPGEYGGGTVVVWDRGTWTPDGDARAGLAKGSLAFRLAGEKLRGGWRLVRTGAEDGADGGRERWLLIKRRDAEASGAEAAPIVESDARSVLSGRVLAEVAAAPERVWRSDRGPGARPVELAALPEGAGPALGNPSTVPGARRGALPDEPRPQLASPVEVPPEGEGWLHEVKLDGYRLLCRVEEGQVRLTTRRGQDWTRRMPGVATAAAALPCRAALLDGEAVVEDARGISRFQSLQSALGRGGEGVVLVAFDLLHLDGWDLTGSPLRARKEALRHLLADLPRGHPLRFGDHLRGSGSRVLEEACRLGVEGVVSKRADAPYLLGRRARAWLKSKCFERQDLVVVGYTDPQGSRAGLGALVLAVHDPSHPEAPWSLAGRVGTGFDAAQLISLRERLEPLERAPPPVHDAPRGAEARGIHWLEPEVVAEVAFTGWTDDGKVRHASFQGLREDACPQDTRRERPAEAPQAASRGRRPRTPPPRIGPVRVTHPDRVLFPEAGVTKLDLVRYYDAVADLMLPFVKDRPLTLLRCPAGRGEKCFYQKRARPSIPQSVPRVVIDKRAGVEQRYLAIDGREALLVLAQHGVIELHVWGSRSDRLERPDRMVLDLDPGPTVRWPAVVEAARVVRARLTALGLESFVLATGGAGLHVVVPLLRRYGWELVKGFSAAVARDLARAHPRTFTARLAKRERRGKVFVDYLRNARESTAIAPYSARARPGAPVAVPITWADLDPERPPRWTARDAAAIVAAPDPWPGYVDVRQGLTQRARKALGMVV